MWLGLWRFGSARCRVSPGRGAWPRIVRARLGQVPAPAFQDAGRMAEHHQPVQRVALQRVLEVPGGEGAVHDGPIPRFEGQRHHGDDAAR